MSENFKDQTKHGHIWNYSERAAARNLGKAVERAGAGQGRGGIVTFAFTNRRTYVWITCFSTLYLVFPPPIPSPFSPTLFLRALFSLLSAAMFPSPPVPLASRHSARKKFLKLPRSFPRLFQRNGGLNIIYYLS